MNSSVPQPITDLSVCLLQPDAVMQQRASDVTALGEYLLAVQAAVATALVAFAQRPVASGFVVMAVRPGRQSRSWLDVEPGLPPALARALVLAAESVAPLDVQGGPVVVALSVGLWGGKAPSQRAPVPEAWRSAAKAATRPLGMDELLAQVWPASANT